MPVRVLEIPYRTASPLRTLLALMDWRFTEVSGLVFFFLVKQTPVWLMAPAIGLMMTLLASPEVYPLWVLYAVMGSLAFLQLQNVITHVFFARRLSAKVRDLERSLRAALVRRLQQLSISFHDETETGRLQAKVLRDVEAVEQFCKQAVVMILTAASGLTFIVVYTLWTKPWVTAFFVVAAPICVGLIRLFKGRLRSSNRAFRVDVEQMSSRVSEMIDMTHVTRAHGAEGSEIREVDQHLQRVQDSGERLDIIQALFQASTWVTFQVTQGVCLMATGLMCWYGYLDLKEVVVFQFMFTQMVGNVSSILSLMPVFAKGMESVRSLGEVLECPDLERNAGKTAVGEVRGAVAFEGISFGYRNATEHAVRDFSLAVAPGTCVAFVGESGSGKSTIMNLIIGFYRPSEGRLLLDGMDAETLDLRTWRRQIAVVGQDVVLFSGSIRENICYGLDRVDEAHLRRVIEAANVAEFIDRLPDGLDTQIGENGAMLSGGQRQRIAIARALIRDPKVIILDEATSALDVISEKLVQEAIDHLVQGRTTFIVAHRLSTIRNADLICVMKDGECIERGSQEELLEQGGEFARLKALQE